MGKHAGEAARRSKAPKRRLAGLAIGVTATVVAWGVLVYAAIGFGADARAGDSVAWLFVGLGTLGAAACLLMALILGQRLFDVLRERGVAVAPPAPPGGRRARR